MTKPDTILGCFNFAVDDREWLRDRVKVVLLVDAVLSTELGKLTRFAGIQGAMKKARSVEDVRALIATGKSDVFALTERKNAPRMTTALTLTTTALGVEVRCYDEELVARRATVIDDVLNVAVAIRRAGCVGGLRFGYVAPVVREMAAYVYPRPRPPRLHDTIDVAAIVDVVDRTFHEGDHPDATQGARQMLVGPLPSPGRRDEVDGLVMIRWADDLEDVAALDRGCAAHEEWLASLLPTMIHGPYDERGDAAAPMRELEARQGMTMYDPRTKTAYVAVVVFPDGEPEAHAFDLAVRLTTERAAPDGSPVQNVRLVAPSRALALALAVRAKRRGIDAVLYAASDGTWRDPDPPGSWAYPPRPS